jgi:PAS domain S-box-containing protein
LINAQSLTVDAVHTLKELEQQKIILVELNKYLIKKVDKLQKLKGRDETAYEVHDELKGLGKKLKEVLTKSEKLRTKLRQSIEIISSNEKKYRSLYDNSPSLLRSINPKGLILDCNQRYAKTLGYKKDEIIGSSIFAHAADKNLDEQQRTFEAWKHGNVIKNKEVWLKKKNGIVFPCMMNVTDVYDDNGNVIGTNTVLYDVSEIYEARKKINEYNNIIKTQLRELSKVDRAKDEFLALISHELRTPLVPIISYTDLLLLQVKGTLNEKQVQQLDTIKANAKHVLELITNLLELHKIELGKFSLNKERCSLHDIIENTVSKLRLEFESHGAKVTTLTKKNLFCPCDKQRIEQVLAFLMTNSIQFCVKNQGKIKIILDVKNRQAEIMIKDNGIGIPKNKISSIFQKFYQVDSSLTREHMGLGMGLSLCKGIIELHGGKIWAESKGKNRGAEIHILLPMLKNIETTERTFTAHYAEKDKAKIPSSLKL